MNNIVYLDNAATTQPDVEILNKMAVVTSCCYGNPSSIYSIGQESKEIIIESQRKIGNLFNCNPNDIIFTSGGTESNNLAIFGTLKKTNKKHIITSSIEHPSVMNSMKYLQTIGYNITYLPTNNDGIVNISNLENIINDDTALISIMFVNNEIGTIQPIEYIGQIAKKFNIKFHCDAIQAAGCVKIDVEKLNIDLLSISGHKLYTPKGIGCLYCRDLDISNILYGGHQQRNIRPGTENIGYIHGLGVAIDKLKENHFNKELKEYTMKSLNTIENIIFNGRSDTHIINFRIPNVNNELLIIKLGLKDIFVSGGSACNSGQPEPSYVLKSLGLSDNECKECIRISLGKNNSRKDIDIFVNELKNILRNQI